MRVNVMALTIEPRDKHSGAPVSGAAPQSSVLRSLADHFRGAVSRATTFLAEALREGSASVHPEFREIDGWNWNKLGRQTSGMPTPELKVRFFFDASDFHLLNDAQFPVKFTLNSEESVLAQYCGFAYPLKNEQFQNIEAWATRFMKAAVFTYGGERDGQWIPGEFVREILKTGP